MVTDYKSAGVDVEAGYEAVKLMKKDVQSTYDDNVLGSVGGFGGMYSLKNFNYKKPVLISGTDGVGTKLKIAFALGKHDTVGIDCVAMCVNDIICQGAKPMFFLDYIASGKLDPSQVAAVVSGIAHGCKESGCALIGGETAEMPGFYPVGEYDLAGFTVGIADEDNIIDGHRIKTNDVLIGLASSGVHSNGFSLIRKLIGDDATSLNKYDKSLGKTIGEELLTPTKLYVKPVLNIIDKFDIKGIAHITGGGFIENIPRMLPKGLGAEINLGSWTMPKIFNMLVEKAGISVESAYNTFNMGIGMVMVVAGEIAEAVVAEYGDESTIIGSVTNTEGVNLKAKCDK